MGVNPAHIAETFNPSPSLGHSQTRPTNGDNHTQNSNRNPTHDHLLPFPHSHYAGQECNISIEW